ncbi:MAG: hypothetical protein U0838_04865 [Chloroflexota bacterium]
MGAYLYSPAFAQPLTPLTIWPWPVFVTIWTGINFAALWFVLGRWSLPSMLFLPIPFEIISGNVHLLYAAAIVAGFRVSASWALMLLTKITPGVGLLWFAVAAAGPRAGGRRDWRPRGLVSARPGSLARVVRHPANLVVHAPRLRVGSCPCRCSCGCRWRGGRRHRAAGWSPMAPAVRGRRAMPVVWLNFLLAVLLPARRCGVLTGAMPRAPG